MTNIINKNVKKKKNQPAQAGNKGFALLYAVMISSMLLAIALGVTDISLKEIKFGTSAKDTNEAFFAADTGAECALFYDKSTGGVFITGTSPSITCNNDTFTANESPTSYWKFVLTGLGSEEKGCAKVTVDKTDLAPCNSLTCIVSKGYNDGGNDPGLCVQGSN